MPYRICSIWTTTCFYTARVCVCFCSIPFTLSKFTISMLIWMAFTDITHSQTNTHIRTHAPTRARTFRHINALFTVKRGIMFYYDFILLQNDFQCWCEIAPIEIERQEVNGTESANRVGWQMNEAVHSLFGPFGVYNHIHMALCLSLFNSPSRIAK